LGIDRYHSSYLEGSMASVLFITAASDAPVPQLELLGHSIKQIGMDPALVANAPRHELTILDGREHLLQAKSMARILQAAGWQIPVVLLVQESALAAITSEWGIRDFILANSSLAEIDVRIKMAVDSVNSQSVVTNSTGLTIDEVSYTAKINGKTLDLTFKEFELLRHLNDNPGRVFSREQLLSEVWGYDYFGGTRTVDVHVRRLRAKLGEHESLIGTVRNVGYRLNPDGSPED
jgi:DNA-binding response OmpR family regulator